MGSFQVVLSLNEDKPVDQKPSNGTSGELKVSELTVKMVCPTGIEPVTHSLEGCCSIQLSYGQKMLHQQKHKRPGRAFVVRASVIRLFSFLKVKNQEMVGAAGFELATLCSQSRCATRLRYAPTGLILTLKPPLLGVMVEKVMVNVHPSEDSSTEAEGASIMTCLFGQEKGLQKQAFCQGAVSVQLPRVMGMPRSPGKANCLASSSLASELRCTSSGPSAKRKVRWWA